MPADIFAMLTAQTPTTTTTTTQTQAQPQTAEDGEGVLFASIMTELTAEAPELITEDVNVPEVPTLDEQPATFTASNCFTGPVLDVLTNTEGEISPVVLPQEAGEAVDDEDIVIWPEDEAQTSDVKDLASRITSKISERIKSDYPDGEISDEEAEAIALQVIADEVPGELPEELKQELTHAVREVADTLKHEGRAETQPVVKVMDAVAGHLSPKPAHTQPVGDDDSDDDEQPLQPEADSQTVSIAGTPNVQPQTDVQTPQTSKDTDSHADVTDAPSHHAARSQLRSTRTPDANSQPSPEPADTPQSTDTPRSFEQALREHTDSQGEQGQEESNSNEQQGENFGQGFGQSDGGRNGRGNSSRSRNDSRRIDTSNTNERATTSTTTHRTNSHASFQSYFEGVLNSRRTSSTPAPMNLRTANFTQSATLRTGITNVVRFIRADGVQKASIVVDPPALGRISVELTSSTSGVEATIKVASEQIRQLVQNELSQLRMNLTQQGVQVAEFTVDVQQDNSGRGNPQQQEQERGQFSYIAPDEDEGEEFRIDLEDGLLYWVA